MTNTGINCFWVSVTAPYFYIIKADTFCFLKKNTFLRSAGWLPGSIDCPVICFYNDYCLLTISFNQFINQKV